jgi:hypothetical protein
MQKATGNPVLTTNKLVPYLDTVAGARQSIHELWQVWAQEVRYLLVCRIRDSWVTAALHAAVTDDVNYSEDR